METASQTTSAEQRTNLKFLVKLGKTPSEALELLQQVYGDETMSRSHVFEWHKRFKEGRQDVEDDPRSGRPSTSRTDANVERVRQAVRDDRRMTVRLIASELGMNRDSVWKIITEDLGMRKICAKMVPKLLTDDQKDRRLQVCQDILERLETEPGLLRRTRLAPCDFFLFLKLKGVIKGTRFRDVDAIKRAVTMELRRIPGESFQGCMDAWQKRMGKCSRLEGDYFEGDNL